MEHKTISVESASGIALHNSLTTQSSQRLLALLPGVGYTVDKPLLHYLMRIGLEQGYDVLSVKYYFHVTQQPFQWEHIAVAQKDAEDAVQGALVHSYDELVLVGKSLGTPIAAMIASKHADITQALILLTPIRDAVRMIDNMRTLAIIGTQDSAYDPDHVKNTDTVTWRVHDGLNHSLEKPGDWQTSARVMVDILSQCADFLKG